MSESGLALRIDREAGTVTFWIHVSPRSRRGAVGGVHDDALRVAVAAPPVDGKANAACVDALVDALPVNRRDVDIDPGSRGRRKRVVILSAEQPLVDELNLLARVPRPG